MMNKIVSLEHWTPELWNASEGWVQCQCNDSSEAPAEWIMNSVNGWKDNVMWQYFSRQYYIKFRYEKDALVFVLSNNGASHVT